MLFYFVGIKGSALSALAKILAEQGHLVRGVDTEENFYTIKKNSSLGIENFSNMKLKKCYFYIIGNAFVNHSVTKFIQNMKYTYMLYPQFLNYHFKNKKWICVAGTSGKTTTTKILATLLPNSTALIGDGTYQTSKEDTFVLESCEYRNTFLNYTPDISLILNVNYDHVDFFKTKDDYIASFIKFASKSKICVINGDEFYFRDSHIITYGMKKENDVIFTYDQGKITLLRKTFELPIKGIKYAYDFAGAYVVAKLLNQKDHWIQNRISTFTMPKRRFERVITKEQVLILDYAHHPAEIDTIFEMLNEEYKDKKKICIFEPHTLTRLEFFLNQYREVLHKFDSCYLYPLFSSVREANNIVLEKKLYKELGFPLYNIHSRSSLYELQDCVICFLGAGNIDQGYHQYMQEKVS